MKLNALLADDDAVSPVIGVILMVAITVILAAVIGTFVLGLGDTAQARSPSASFDTDYDSSNSKLTLTHESGEAVDATQLDLKGDIDSSASVSDFSGASGVDGDEVSSGDSIVVTNTGTAGSGDYAFDSQSDEATVRIVWTSDDGENTATLKKWTGPGA